MSARACVYVCMCVCVCGRTMRVDAGGEYVCVLSACVSCAVCVQQLTDVLGDGDGEQRAQRDAQTDARLVHTAPGAGHNMACRETRERHA